MITNQHGGIISKIFIIPVGVALMAGFFFLGYYTGKYQSRSAAQTETVLPLPDMAAKNPVKQEEFTFYKTLADKDNKTVSIDLKPRSTEESAPVEKKQPQADSAKRTAIQSQQKDRKSEAKLEKPAPTTAPKETVIKKPQVQTKKEPVIVASSNSKLRYTLQLASYQEKEAAEEDVRKMKKHGYAAFIVSSELPGKGMWHRVRLGSFSNKAAAEKLQKEIHAKEGSSPIIVAE